MLKLFSIHLRGLGLKGAVIRSVAQAGLQGELRQTTPAGTPFILV